MCGLHRRAGAARRILVLVTSCRFPPPWTVENIGAAFVVKDSAGQKLAYVYFEDEPGAFNTTAMSRTRLTVVV